MHMREYEMRIRIECFIRTRMRGMLAPMLGLGLAVTGCKQEGVTPVYSAPLSDGSTDQVGQIFQDTAITSPDVNEADAPHVSDTHVVTSDTFPPDMRDAPVKDTMDGAIDWVKADRVAYEASASETENEVMPPDAGMDAQDSRADTKKDLGLVVKYMAQLPDSGSVVALYMARMPDADS
jgi:hypothetical protein